MKYFILTLSSWLGIQSFTWSGWEWETWTVDLVILLLVGQTNFVTTLDWSLATSGNKPYCEAMTE